MNEATCKTCPWFHSTPEMSKNYPSAGYCRINPPIPTSDPQAMQTYAEWPWMLEGTVNWCGQHPQRADTRPLTEGDVRRIFRLEMERWAISKARGLKR